jgi:HAD superfamily hydrolase (TIGR01490 family)
MVQPAASSGQGIGKGVQRFAVFDIDGTLIRWQLFHAIVHHLGQHGYIPAEVHKRIVQARMVWKRRTTDDEFERYELLLVKEYLVAIKQLEPQQYHAIVQEVFDEYKDQAFTYTRDLIKELKQQGYFLLAISGSPDEIIQLLSKRYGFDAAIGATFEQIDGRFSGAIDSPIFDKAGALQRFVDTHRLSYKDSVGVGDGTGDVPMLALVDHPIVLNPNKHLFAMAQERNWDIVVERKNMIYKLHPQNGKYILQ